MVPPNGPALAFSSSTWIHWWSPVASANWFTRSWVISTQSVVPISSPAAASISSKVVNTRIDDAPGIRWGSPARGLWLDGGMAELTREVIRRAPKVLLHDHLDGGLRPQTIVELAAVSGHQLPAGDAESLGRW